MSYLTQPYMKITLVRNTPTVLDYVPVRVSDSFLEDTVSDFLNWLYTAYFCPVPS